MKNKKWIHIGGVAIIVIAILITIYEKKNSDIVLNCQGNIYAFNKNEFKWLFDRKNQSFRYTKPVIKYSDESAFYAGNDDEPANGAEVEIDRVMGAVVFRWEFRDVPQKQLYTCRKLKKLPKPLKAQF